MKLQTHFEATTLFSVTLASVIAMLTLMLSVNGLLGLVHTYRFLAHFKMS